MKKRCYAHEVNSQTSIKQQFLSSVGELPSILAEGRPIIFLGSRTSTVIPFDHLDEDREYSSFPMIIDSSKLPSHLEIEEGVLCVKGPVNWKEAKSYCQSHGRTIMTSPTEELAQILSGVATSCTGERCFGFGTLRDQIIELEFMNSEGVIETLKSDRLLKDHKLFDCEKGQSLLSRYQESYLPFENYKNAPFPRFEKKTDLMVGTEGQLGIVTKGKFSTDISEPVVFLFFSLPKWEEDYRLHLDIYEKAQSYREAILACELIDENSWSYLDASEIPVQGRDTIFLEIRESQLERIYEELILKLEGIREEDIFSMPATKCHELRMKIPRAIFEHNSKMGVVKKGTDVQAIGDKFPKLLDLYKGLSHKGIRYNLFGHFGDAHLHFNFMPSPDQVEDCATLLQSFYGDALELGSSPFAEHGIGLLKQKFIRPFLGPVQYEMYKYLKSRLDPKGILFPQGYMGLTPIGE